MNEALAHLAQSLRTAYLNFAEQTLFITNTKRFT